MFKPTPEQLTEILELHRKWLSGENGGVRAILDGASLDGASLVGARLVGARLDRARLDRARLDPIKADVFKILETAKSEVPGLLAAIKDGRIEGSVYKGDCACLVGTIANLRNQNVYKMPDIVTDTERPAERWFLAIRNGDTPENNPVSAISAQWIEEWLSTQEEIAHVN